MAVDKDPVSPGEARLKQYWGYGAGSLKIQWGVPGDFNRCVLQVGRYIQNQRMLKGFCANLHKQVLGYWPGQGPHARGKH